MGLRWPQQQWRRQQGQHTNPTGRRCCWEGVRLCLRKALCNGQVPMRLQSRQHHQQVLLVLVLQPPRLGASQAGVNRSHQKQLMRPLSSNVRASLCLLVAAAQHHSTPGQQHPLLLRLLLSNSNSSSRRLVCQRHQQCQRQRSQAQIEAAVAGGGSSTAHSSFRWRSPQLLQLLLWNRTSVMLLNGARCCLLQLPHLTGNSSSSASTAQPAG